MTHLDQLVALFQPRAAVRRSNKTSMQNTYSAARARARARQLFDRYLISSGRARARIDYFSSMRMHVCVLETEVRTCVFASEVAPAISLAKFCFLLYYYPNCAPVLLCASIERGSVGMFRERFVVPPRFSRRDYMGFRKPRAPAVCIVNVGRSAVE